MQTRLESPLRRLAGALALGLALLSQACAPTVKTTYRHEMSMYMNGDTRAEQDQLLMEAEPLLVEALSLDPQLKVQLPYQIVLPLTNTAVERTADVTLIGAPAFKVKITNRTGHVVRMNGAVIRLRDDLGNTYDGMNRDQLEATIYNLPAAFAAHGMTLSPNAVSTAINASRRLKLLDENTTLLPDSTTTWFVPFLTPAQGNQGFDVEAYDGFMSTAQVLTLTMYDVVTETDTAGNPTVKATFEFPFEVKTFQQTWTGQDLTATQEVVKQ